MHGCGRGMGEGGQGETTREESGVLWLPHTIGLDHKVLLLKRHAQTVCVCGGRGSCYKGRHITSKEISGKLRGK